MVVWLGEVCHSPGRYNFLVRVTQQWQVWKVLPAPGCTSSLLESGARGGLWTLASPGLLCVSTGQRDPPSGQTFL